MRVLLAILAVLPAVCTGADSTPWPTYGWTVSTPEEQGMDSARLEAAAQLIEQNSPTRFSLLVVRNGRLVFERYFNGSRAADSNNIKSMSKSILSVLTGIAVEEGLLRGTDQKLCEFFPEYFRPGDDPRKREVTLDHLLTMTAGFEWAENTDISTRCFTSGDWHRFVIESPLTSAPGEVFNYSTGLTHLLSGILTRASGSSTLEYASSRLFAPLGITCYRWSRDPRGYCFGGSEVWLTPRDLAKFGLLVLRNGMWQDRRIVPDEWMRSSTRLRVRTGSALGDYARLWWKYTLNGYPVTLASGYGGQNILLAPELDLMMVTTARSDIANQGEALYSQPYELFARNVIPAVIQPAPQIPAGGVVEAAGYTPLLAQGSFATVFGSGFSPLAATWDYCMPADGRFPPGVGGITVRLGGRTAYPYYVSPAQINFLVPPDTEPGRYRLDVYTPQGRASQDVDVAAFAPALFTFERSGKRYATPRPVRAGECIELWASGLGPTSPAPPAGAALAGHLPLVSKPRVLVAGRPAEVLYAALAYAGVYQLNIRVPDGIAPGTASIELRGPEDAAGAEAALEIAN